MDYFFLVSYHGSTYNKLEKSLDLHPKIQKIPNPLDKKKFYFNCIDVENSKVKHKDIFAGSYFFDTSLENYEIASVDVLKNYFIIYYFDETNTLNDNTYLGYRLRRMYEMMNKTKDFVIYFYNESNFSKIASYLEEKFKLQTPIVDAKEYSTKLMGYEKCEKDKVYYKIIREQFGEKILT